MPKEIKDYQDLCETFEIMKPYDFKMRENLDYMRSILSLFSSPQDEMGKIFHVTGTNGKGSVCWTIARSLKLLDVNKVGLLVSPHIYSYTERISINGKNISEADLVRLSNFVLKVLEENNLTNELGPVGLLVCVAFIYFRENKTNYVVIEGGIGAKLDHTNVIMKPITSVITSIGLEHTDLLGNTKAAILTDKAEIIKAGCPIIVGPTIKKECLENIIESKASSISSPVIYVAPETTDDYSHLNRKIAYEVLKLGFSDLKFSEINKIVPPPGRYQTVTLGKNQIIYDVGHNPQGIETFLARYREANPSSFFVFILGMQKTKDYVSCCKLLAKEKYLLKVLLINVKNSAPLEDMKKIFDEAEKSAVIISDEKLNIKNVINDESDFDVIVAGSFFTVAKVSEMFNHNLIELYEPKPSAKLISDSEFNDEKNIAFSILKKNPDSNKLLDKKNQFTLFYRNRLQFHWNSATDRDWQLVQRFIVGAYAGAYHKQPFKTLALGKSADKTIALWQSVYEEACQKNQLEILETKIIKPLQFYFSHDKQFLEKESAELKEFFNEKKELDHNTIQYLIKLTALKIYFEHCFEDEKNNIEKFAIKRIHYVIAYWCEHPVGFISCELNRKSARTYLRWVFVAPGFHQLGLGRQLLEIVSKRFPESKGIELYTRKANKPSQLFYKSCGLTANEKFDFTEPKTSESVANAVLEWLYGDKLYPPADDGTDEPEAHIGFYKDTKSYRF